MRRHIIPILALFFAVTGTGIAASRYVITSTSQIKPSVLHNITAEALAAASEKAARKGAHAITARFRSVGPITPNEWGEPEALDPLTPATWTQHAEEDTTLAGQAIFEVPSAAGCTDNGGKDEAAAVASVWLDGGEIGRAEIRRHEAGEGEHIVPISFNRGKFQQLSWLFEPGHAQSHSVTAQVFDQCGALGGSKEQHFVLKSVSIDAIGVR